MEDPPAREPREDREAPEQEELAPTPFDSPFVLPVLFLGLTLWFGYDGWLNPDPEMQRWWWFNQGGAIVFALAGLFTLRRALRERARERQQGG